MRVDTALVRELAELLTANELTEIEVEDGDRKIKVRRDMAPVVSAAPAPIASPPALSGPPAQAKEDLGSQDGEVAGESIKSPMVGTVYLSPGPGIIRKIMVSDGQPVEFDQPLVVLG